MGLVLPETIRSSTSVSHVIGSMPFNLAGWISIIAIAQCCAPPSELANNAFFLVSVFLHDTGKRRSVER